MKIYLVFMFRQCVLMISGDSPVYLGLAIWAENVQRVSFPSSQEWHNGHTAVPASRPGRRPYKKNGKNPDLQDVGNLHESAHNRSLVFFV